MDENLNAERTISLAGATSVGVGAIVGGGILALAGAAFAATGPGAIVAFMLNGLIAVLTALSFAEMSAAFPQSGGAYIFAKKILSVRAAFMVGWIVWFASIVAATLYAIGFAAFTMIIFRHIWEAFNDTTPAWMTSPRMITLLAVAATACHTHRLTRQSSGEGGFWMNIGKVVVFGLLIAGGLWAVADQSAADIKARFIPFFPGGAMGLVQAMGYSFIAFQGFDLIAAVAGEIREPDRIIPKAMLFSLGIALAIYLPLLFIVATVGTPPGESVMTAAAAQPEAVIAMAAQNYLGQFGYWLVMVAAVLSMLSALQANLFAASRVALTMSRDRTLPRELERISEQHGTPVASVHITFLIVIILLIIVSDVSAAGAASSLIFLLTFALAHCISILSRIRNGKRRSFQSPCFPLVPGVGALACISLAIFQGIAVPSAGIITAAWLTIGGILYLGLFARRARVVDASAEAADPLLVQLRGRSPLVLVPIANPANADSMVTVANTLAPPGIGRVLLLSVFVKPVSWRPGDSPQQLLDVQSILGESLIASFAAGLSPEALTTVATNPWTEIARVAQTYRCKSLLLGFSDLDKQCVTGSQLEELMNIVDCDVVVLRASKGWHISEVRRVLVPVGGQGGQDELRARLLSSLWRRNVREITFLQVLSEKATPRAYDEVWQELSQLVRDEIPGLAEVKVVQSGDVCGTIIHHAEKNDLVILGMQQIGYRRVFGEMTLRIASNTKCPIIMISRRV